MEGKTNENFEIISTQSNELATVIVRHIDNLITSNNLPKEMDDKKVVDATNNDKFNQLYGMIEEINQKMNENLSKFTGRLDGIETTVSELSRVTFSTNAFNNKSEVSPQPSHELPESINKENSKLVESSRSEQSGITLDTSMESISLSNPLIQPLKSLDTDKQITKEDPSYSGDNEINEQKPVISKESNIASELVQKEAQDSKNVADVPLPEAPKPPLLVLSPPIVFPQPPSVSVPHENEPSLEQSTVENVKEDIEKEDKNEEQKEKEEDNTIAEESVLEKDNKEEYNETEQPQNTSIEGGKADEDIQIECDQCGAQVWFSKYQEHIIEHKNQAERVRHPFLSIFSSH
eukprot:MONOS_5314.1-p1 / transcript=MONOS_5314.1 / gene=MONOS_5314 / organism=Monocercomonoides_exilis_PA203 / gene_product=unspecified product / transcript_product=unspecified product / location=Mono_scaffold00153:40448-41616(-) / protein_length=348 / sequence_SO=supercontig / SO=protein_coding / is_pseudo=false